MVKYAFSIWGRDLGQVSCSYPLFGENMFPFIIYVTYIRHIFPLFCSEVIQNSKKSLLTFTVTEKVDIFIFFKEFRYSMCRNLRPPKNDQRFFYGHFQPFGNFLGNVYVPCIGAEKNYVTTVKLFEGVL